MCRVGTACTGLVPDENKTWRRSTFCNRIRKVLARRVCVCVREFCIGAVAVVSVSAQVVGVVGCCLDRWQVASLAVSEVEWPWRRWCGGGFRVADAGFLTNGVKDASLD